MAIDPLSDVLRFMRTHCVISGALVAGGAWAVRWVVEDEIKFWGLVRGGCTLQFEGRKTSVRIEAGDVFMVAAPRTFVLSGAPGAPVVDALRIPRAGATGQLGTGDEVRMVGGRVELDPSCATMLAEALPPFVHVRASSPHARALPWLMQELVQERTDDAPGADVAAAQLAQLIFIRILRAHFDGGGRVTAGWLRAARDPRLAPALRLMHAEPGRAWQLDELARAAAMSRAGFAAYFKDVAGVSPIAYLTDWRMRLAARALRDDDTTIAALATELGYASESAFSHAFKRVTGTSPSAHRRRFRAGAAPSRP